MADKINYRVLIFPGGTEIGLEIFNALRGCKEVELFSASNNTPNHAPYVHENNYVIPDVSCPDWVDAVNGICLKHQIHFIFPANPYVIDALIIERERLFAPVILPESAVVKTLRSKRDTYRVFSGKLPLPLTYRSDDPGLCYPVFIKPDNAYGAQNAVVASDPDEMKLILKRPGRENDIVMEYLPGSEYTIDCLSNADGKLLFCQGRTRERVRMGTSMHSEFVDKNLQNWFIDRAEEILKELKITGAWYFQMKEDALGNPKLLEIECRIAGTMAMNRVGGVNFPLLSLYIQDKREIDVLFTPCHMSIDRALANRYRTNLKFNFAYIDLDDTILVNGKVNPDMMRLIYQFINQGVKIILLSKSLARDKIKLLKDNKIAEVFDEIHWLREDESKADYIIHPDSIYIDDSFSQRKKVAGCCCIPTFDLSMIEVLFK